MMGGLHIEMATLSVIGDWVDGSGWTGLLERADINTPGRIESTLSGGDVKRSRYVHQVSLAALHIVLTQTKQSFHLILG